MHIVQYKSYAVNNKIRIALATHGQWGIPLYRTTEDIKMIQILHDKQELISQSETPILSFSAGKMGMHGLKQRGLKRKVTDQK